MQLIEMARELDAMGQTGLAYAVDPYDRDRYRRLREMAAQIRADISNLSKGELVEWNKSEFGYATPKVDVRAFILENDKILLVREDQDRGRWTLPGGWADINDSPSESAIREVREEAGYEVEVDKLLAVYDRERQGHKPPHAYHIYKIFFKCRIIGGQPQANRESSECAFFSIDEIPELSESRTLMKQLIALHSACKVEGPIDADFD